MVRIETGLCVIRFHHYVACLRPRNVVEYLTTGALVHGQATGVVALCIVAKRYVLSKKCLKERIGNQGQRVDFLGRRRRPISTSGFAYMATETAVFAVRSAKPCFSWDTC